jgi:hypothetical protein
MKQCVLFFIVFVNMAVAQTKVTGIVYDAETKEPLPFVGIVFKGSKISATTDFEGRYTIAATVPVDSLVFSYVGYITLKKAVKKNVTQTITVELKPDQKLLDEVVILPGENPAHIILRKVIKNKPKNDKEQYDSYQYEVYNKIEFDLNDIPPNVKDKKVMKPLKWVFDNIDSSNVKEKPYLPLIISEAISDFYFKRNPKNKKEVIKGTKISGVEDKSFSKFMGEMYLAVNIYDNNLIVFEKYFASPISDNGLFYYKYYLIDSMYVGNNWCYQIQFKPKRKQELLFEGNMWIADTSFALKQIEMKIAGDANINYVRAFNVMQEFTPVDSFWMLKKEKLVVDFKLQKNQAGFYGRKTTSYKDFKINKPMPDEFYSRTDNLIVNEDALNKDNTFWEENRHDTLSKNENQIYQMVDSIQKMPLYKTWQDIIVLFYSGYKVWGYWEFGPYYNLVSMNQFEGVRLRVGGRTSNKFSRWCEINGFVAYGTKDERFKYKAQFKTFITKKPRQILYLDYKNDYELLGQSQYSLTTDNILSSLFRRNPLNALYDVAQYRFGYEFEPFNGWNNQVYFINRIISPIDTVFTYAKSSSESATKPNIKTTEIKFISRFAWGEKYIEGTFSRQSTGTRNPVVQLEYTPGLKGVFNSDYTYHKLYINVDDRIRINPIGYINYVLEAGKIWGKVPFPLMFLHPGNETYVYDWAAYNLMNFYEFGSDQFVAASIFHHFDGFFLNKIPLMRKLKWREVFTAKCLIGTTSEANRNELSFPNGLSSFKKGPYYEMGAGIENIFRIFRMDLFWRLSYIDQEYKYNYKLLTGKKVPLWGLRGSIQVIF